MRLKCGAAITKGVIESKLSAKELVKVREAQRRNANNLNKRKTYGKINLNSYLGVCVDVGQINRAFNLLLKYTSPKSCPMIDVQHYNIVLKGWAKLGSIAQIVETRMHMIRNNVEPNAETFACILLGYSKGSIAQKSYVRKLLHEMRRRDIDPKTIFQSSYFNTNERKLIKNLLKTVDPKYDDDFCPVPIDYNCKLMNARRLMEPINYKFAGNTDLSKLDSWAENQRITEWKASIFIKSILKDDSPSVVTERYTKLWQKFSDMWRKAIIKSLDEGLEALQQQCSADDKIHLYPYICSVDKNTIVHLMLDEIENNASFSSYSMSTNNLHLQFGTKLMIRYMRFKSTQDGSLAEKQRVYTEYLQKYCTNPDLLGEINSREFIQITAKNTKNYAIYRDRFSPIEQWPHHIVAAVGQFFYGIILKEIKFDPDVVKNPKKDIKMNNLVHAFYTAYFQVDSTHKIKEEFRAHQDFETLYQKACGSRLKFDYSYLPTTCPPMPWLSHDIGGYLTNRTDLVRISTPFAEQAFSTRQMVDNQKLYPSLDSLNAVSLCPWIVNKEILDLVIDLFKAGGNDELSVPLSESTMELAAPILEKDAGKAAKILFSKEKRKYDQKRREMYSLWRDCLYRLSIANHFRDKIIWFPHNMDFRGRTYPVPPHFNHLGADLARSLLLFAKGQPLGEIGLDWLKLHLINLVGKMKSAPLAERLDYANSILHLEVLDSADNPWDGRRWWTNNENPWQVLACCKEIAKAIRSKDHKQYISHFPVHQDGSCNGLQHYAALGRDSSGGLAVNLVPCDRPQDVYSRVVDIVEKMRKCDVEKGVKVAQQLDGFIQRKVIKQTVMTTVYGVTRYGARQQIARQLVARGYPENEVWKTAQYLAARTFDSIGQMFHKSRLIQDWLCDCAYVISSKYRQLVSWETPLGFPVVQPYTLPYSKTSNRLLASSIGVDIPFYNDPLSRINTSKQRSAFPPNYIHSLDSSHMMLTSLYCQQQGITFVSVHDCYWTHPSTVNIMNQVCRQQFVALHSEPLLQELSNQFLTKFKPLDDELEEKPSKKSKRIQNVVNPNLSTNEQLKVENLKINSASSSSSSSSGYDDELVDADLLSMIEEVDSRQEVVKANKAETSIKPLIQLYDEARKASIRKSRATFEQVPTQGDLKLEAVLKSTYFFS